MTKAPAPRKCPTPPLNHLSLALSPFPHSESAHEKAETTAQESEPQKAQPSTAFYFGAGAEGPPGLQTGTAARGPTARESRCRRAGSRGLQESAPPSRSRVRITQSERAWHPRLPFFLVRKSASLLGPPKDLILQLGSHPTHQSHVRSLPEWGWGFPEPTSRAPLHSDQAGSTALPVSGSPARSDFARQRLRPPGHPRRRGGEAPMCSPSGQPQVHASASFPPPPVSRFLPGDPRA